MKEEQMTKGQAGIIFACECDDPEGPKGKFVMKQFKKGKSIARFIKEIDFQRRAAEIGVSPRVMDFSEGTAKEPPFFIMEKLDSTLPDVIKAQGGLYLTQLQAIQRLYEKLDNVRILHNDANLHNIMVRKRPREQWFIVDFGKSKEGKKNISMSFELVKERIQRAINQIPSSHALLKNFNKGEKV